jgi:alpha-glucosidase (family GH31 glycosyl hydrolase)
MQVCISSLAGRALAVAPPFRTRLQTNGDNEPWTLVNTTDNYDAIVDAIRFRDQMRNYVMDTQAAWSSSNAPMISPVWLLFPGDPVCAFTPNGDEPACAEEFMFGPDWLAKPVTSYLQRSAWVYLPALPSDQVWVYHFNESMTFTGPVNITLPTPVNEFPLFYRNTAAR